MSKNSVFLDVDPSIKENGLKLMKEESSQEIEKLLSATEYPSRCVKPFPGFCVKTKDAMGEKFFLNICHCDLIPQPPSDYMNLPISEELNKDVSEFRVPMSIGQVRHEKDAKGAECRVCDVAINSVFFKKIEYLTEWRDFLLTIIFEAIKEKYAIDCMEESKIILQNRKHLGSLQQHRIQDREMAMKMGISELPKNNDIKPKIEMLSTTKFEKRCPEYRLFKKKEKQSCLVGEFRFPDVISANELKLDVGEDRIIIEAEERNYFLDIFIPAFVRPDSTNSIFDKASKILTVTMPLVGG